jgi:hypothetical protein
VERVESGAVEDLGGGEADEAELVFEVRDGLHTGIFRPLDEGPVADEVEGVPRA